MQVGTYPTRNFALAVTNQTPQGTIWFGLAQKASGSIISVDLYVSPRRTDCLFASETEAVGVQSLRILAYASFLLIIRTGRIVTAHLHERVAPDSRTFQHIANCTCRIAATGGTD